MVWHRKDYDQVMLATGDFKHWMIVDRKNLLGNNDRKYYRNQPILVESSSEQCDPYYCKLLKSSANHLDTTFPARMFRKKEDVWLSIR